MRLSASTLIYVQLVVVHALTKCDTHEDCQKALNNTNAWYGGRVVDDKDFRCRTGECKSDVAVESMCPGSLLGENMLLSASSMHFLVLVCVFYVCVCVCVCVCLRPFTTVPNRTYLYP